jgi:hypothetical protein
MKLNKRMELHFYWNNWAFKITKDYDLTWIEFGPWMLTIFGRDVL